METLGALSILLAFCLAIYAVVGSVVGAVKHRPYLTKSAERAVYGVFFLLTVASGILVYALLVSDFRLAYVAARSNRAMPAVYKFAAWWGGQEGSLLLWSWLLSLYSAVVVFTNRRKLRDMMPWVLTVLMATQVFFLTLNAFVEPPFQVLAVGKGVQAVADGQGLNPLLQYWTMAIHPPMLYLGYVGFIVPFAFAIGSLVTKQPGDAWIHTTRRWSLITWGFQSIGILLGAGWAYAVLGWGGYWGWDPVENASLLPWITATAFLHSVMMQEKKGMMKVWNMVLISATFFLCIFGTFLTRSGIVSSVHAFAQSSLGNWFVGFLAIGIALTTGLILRRLDYLKSEAHLESVLSRESSFLFNNLILLASCFAVLWGTMFPVITEAVMGEKVTVGAPFFNKVNIPIGLFLLFLTGVGPLIAWRRSSWDSLKRAFFWPTICFAATVAVLVGFGVRHFYALVSLGLCAFVTATIVMEFWKGARAISIKNKMNLLRATVELTHRNTRRYGGYLVHMGIVLMFIGFTGAAFNKDTTREVKLGDHFKLGAYEFQVKEVSDGDNPNYLWQHAVIGVSKGGKFVTDLMPEKRIYKASEQPTSEVAIRRQLNEDVYLNFAGMSQTEADRAIIQAYLFPLVSWIWIGFWVLMMGTIVCLIPSKVKYSYPKTEVVGAYAKEPVAR
ncbi:MAG: heme lyase CcmF/NrfE family subunit [Bryobacteraceae bacterium]|nr:heme lyase CcmF/NrfE family subunit [Solibacteraceae bacterium]MCO5351652.1 heme lyase CcmF/NrfE family subunit [Bryobacteraceae bacterium]